MPPKWTPEQLVERRAARLAPTPPVKPKKKTRESMRLRVTYIVEVDDNFRRALRHYYGRDGMATRQEVAQHFERYGDTLNEDLRSEHGTCCWGDEE